MGTISACIFRLGPNYTLAVIKVSISTDIETLKRFLCYKLTLIAIIVSIYIYTGQFSLNIHIYKINPDKYKHGKADHNTVL